MSKLIELQNKYPKYDIRKSNTSYGRYAITLSPSVYEFFFRLKDLELFLIRHEQDLRTGNVFMRTLKEVLND